jgi:membrane AbrB-like protein
MSPVAFSKSRSGEPGISHPERFPYARFGLGLAIGTIGAVLFLYFKLPLAWMLGSMTACTIASVLGARIEAPAAVVPIMTIVIGVMLGSGFSPGLITELPNWLIPLAGLVVSLILGGVACVLYLRFVVGLNLPDAFFAGMPGGLLEMVILGEQYHADGRTVALVHSCRILLVVLILPFFVQIVSGISLSAPQVGGASILSTPWQSYVFLAATGAVGLLVGHLLRLRAKYLLGPMFVSAAVHLTGLSDFKPPIELLNLAQLVLGTAIGCRFSGMPKREVLRLLGYSVGFTIMLLAITATAAVAVSRVSSFNFLPLLLAYAPGGITEMSLISLALQAEVAFVATHHIFRVFFVTIGAALLFGRMARKY